jgi:hypothetical protein
MEVSNKPFSYDMIYENWAKWVLLKWFYLCEVILKNITQIQNV